MTNDDTAVLTRAEICIQKLRVLSQLENENVASWSQTQTGRNDCDIEFDLERKPNCSHISTACSEKRC